MDGLVAFVCLQILGLLEGFFFFLLVPIDAFCMHIVAVSAARICDSFSDTTL